ncbi:MAG: DUF962 domain-containing protein [Bryobacteraceae bacterium]|nr:DUF962 domain-containing protein [Bryobacteraceae bacterium]
MTTEEYNSHHQHAVSRTMHLVGIPIIVGAAALALWPSRPPFGVLRISALARCAGGWVLLFVRHAIEGNRPAILSRPAALWEWLQWWFGRIASVASGRRS